jgi:spore coat protein YsxE
MGGNQEQVKEILASYRIEPNFIESYGKVSKIYSMKGTFALKRMKAKHGMDFIRHVQTLYQMGFNRIVPIYPTVDGRYAVLKDQHLYYLMPWLPNDVKEDRTERFREMFRQLARMHLISSKEITLKENERQAHYEKMTETWKKEQEALQEMIERCESKTYMSPFELYFCMYYHEITLAYQYAIRKLEEWYEETKEEKKTRVVITHGKVSPEHFLFDENGYGFFTNYERAKMTTPIHDLLPFIARLLKTYPKQHEECIDWIYTYWHHFPFKKDEFLLFQSYLAHPGHMYRLSQDYFNRPKKQSELRSVAKLQQSYWLLKNTEYVSIRMDEIEKSKVEQQKEAQTTSQSE